MEQYDTYSMNTHILNSGSLLRSTIWSHSVVLVYHEIIAMVISSSTKGLSHIPLLKRSKNPVIYCNLSMFCEIYPTLLASIPLCSISFLIKDKKNT